MLELNLATNRIDMLPYGIGHLSRLVVLNLSDNLLTDLPVSIGLCQGLGQIGSGINLDRNPIQDSSMLKKWKIGTDHLLDYLEKRAHVNSFTAAKLPPLPIVDVSSRVTFIQKQKLNEARSLEKLDEERQANGDAAAPSEHDQCVDELDINVPASMAAYPSLSASSPSDVPLSRSATSVHGAAPLGSSHVDETASYQPPPPAEPPGPDPQLELLEKVAKLRFWVEMTVLERLMPRLRHQREHILEARSIEEMLIVAQFLSPMKTEFNRIKALCLGLGVPIPVATVAPPVANVDKTVQMKLTIANALDDAQMAFNCMLTALPAASPVQVTSFVQITRAIIPQFKTVVLQDEATPFL
eukprot:TRINITY_DN11963_c0_g1_i1.p1 TRINITY_DN11963_c0_g1~~TRINITY_DN11963_c0_g1_i1.p1  ORF type:complete len:355 (-),score=124.12 TRINITY_DN11963_c0_g1_i1:29-1093(-)